MFSQTRMKFGPWLAKRSSKMEAKKWRLPKIISDIFNNKVRIRAIVLGTFILLITAIISTIVIWSATNLRQSLRNIERSAKDRGNLIAEILRTPGGQALLRYPHLKSTQLFQLPQFGLPVLDPITAYRVAQTEGCMFTLTRSRNQICSAISTSSKSGAYVYVTGKLSDAKNIKIHQPGSAVSGATNIHVVIRVNNKIQKALLVFQDKPGQSLWVDHRTSIAGYRTGSKFQHDTEVIGTAEMMLDCTVNEDCEHRSVVFSFKVPVDEFKKHIIDGTWPPVAMAETEVIVVIQDPGQTPLSNSENASRQVETSSLENLLEPGELLEVSPFSKNIMDSDVLAKSHKRVDIPYMLPALSKWVDNNAKSRAYKISLNTDDPRVRIFLVSDGTLYRSEIASVVSLLQVAVLAVLVFGTLAWWVVQYYVVLRITSLTKCAGSISKVVTSSENLDQIAISLDEMIGDDEIGVLALALDDLVRKVNIDLRRESKRSEEEHDRLEAISHEILSPLFTLKILNKENKEAKRCVDRMSDAINILYSTAAPGTALASSTSKGSLFDLSEFCDELTHNLKATRFPQIEYSKDVDQSVMVMGEDLRLETAIDHILTNSQRYSPPNRPIIFRYSSDSNTGAISISNNGPHIPSDLIEHIFRYGVTDGTNVQNKSRGQGLFVAKNYISQMGGDISVENVKDGVEFIIRLPIARATV